MNGFLSLTWSWRHLGAAAVTGIVLLGVLYEGQETEVAIAPPAPVKQSTERPTGPVMPKGYAPGAVIRDPFALPQENSVVSSVVSPSPKTAHKSASPTHMLPVLTGIVGTNDHWVAIIKYGGISRSYQIGDVIGPYQLVSVTAAGATVSGAGVFHSLRVSGKGEREKK